MAKADKATVVKRTQEVLRLLLAGGEFDDIRQYASDRGWNLSERQVRRYQERAYQQLAAATERDQKQLLGRHLMQRRALYARALKGNDLRTALQILRDEAQLEGLYPPTKIAPTTPDGLHPYPGASGPPLSREERFIRMLSAEIREDSLELRLLETTAPQLFYKMPDTMMPRQMLNIQALIYVADQLDHASMFLMALWRIALGEDNVSWLDFVGGVHGYRFRVESDAWELYTESLGVDSQQLIAANHHGSMLDLFSDRIYELAPTPAEIIAKLAAVGQPADDLPTPAKIARQWREMLNQVLRR